jgi:hypothetical protein
MFDFSPLGLELLAFSPEEVGQTLAGFARQPELGAAKRMDDALELCREIAIPYRRGREELFDRLEGILNGLYRQVAGVLITRAFPLVIVDEAHNWKNGPEKGANGYKQFCETIACRARRILLLTATPFQLRPEEMIEILKVSDAMMPCPTTEASASLRERATRHREQVLGRVLNQSANASRAFSKSWSEFSRHGTTEQLAGLWSAPEVVSARKHLDETARQAGAIPGDAVSHIAAEAARSLDPEWRPFLKDALRLHAHNADLSNELGDVMVRHRRSVGHRCVRVGNEFGAEEASPVDRPDAHILHAAPGIDVHGDGELAHYLLMRCVTELKRAMGRSGRSSLGSDLTGCYTTLQASAEGRRIAALLQRSPVGASYLELLSAIIKPAWDAKHPKVVPVVKQAVENWRRGEKTLIFCFRINTAERLSAIIEEQIEKELRKQERDCLGGDGNLDALKKRLTARTSGLIAVGLDRVLWSLVAWQATRLCVEPRLTGRDLEMTDDDLGALARISLMHGEEVHGEHVDRVFLTRATEHVISRRLLDRPWPRCVRRVLEEMADPRWVSHPYGLQNRPDEESVGEQPEFDERGVHSVYPIRDAAPSAARVEALAARIRATRAKASQTAGTPVLDAYARAPSLWLGADPQTDWTQPRPVLSRLQRQLWALTGSPEAEGGGLNWESRRKVLVALRRAVLRNSVLVRLLPTRGERAEERWDRLLVEAFAEERPKGQSETFADRLTVFLEDLEAAGGDLAAHDPSQRGMRCAIYDSTRLTDRFVALVKGGGGGGSDQRTRLFTGFNTPLLPEVLVCTQVGQEGIDLHRHCRHVVHYDLAWNPAVMEQRTGRADRIGSKAFREIERAKDGETKPRLEVGVPYLAATYDERMYEELRLRAQAFEVLTGGDFAGDDPEGRDDGADAEGRELRARLVPLPDGMMDDLRVRLQVYPPIPHSPSIPTHFSPPSA